MEAISEVIDIKNRTIHYELPENFRAKRVQLIILPVDEKSGKEPRQNRILALKNSIGGNQADALEKHLKDMRDEW